MIHGVLAGNQLRAHTIRWLGWLRQFRFCSMWFSPSSGLTWASFQASDRGARQQVETCKAPWSLGLELSCHHFCLIISAKTSHFILVYYICSNPERVEGPCQAHGWNQNQVVGQCTLPLVGKSCSVTWQGCRWKEGWRIRVFIFYCFGGAGLGFELMASCLQSRCSTSWATHPVHFALVILEMGISPITCLGWPRTSIILILASQVARIAGVSQGALLRDCNIISFSHSSPVDIPLT
jgi:hypothetical protein